MITYSNVTELKKNHNFLFSVCTYLKLVKFKHSFKGASDFFIEIYDSNLNSKDYLNIYNNNNLYLLPLSFVETSNLSTYKNTHLPLKKEKLVHVYNNYILFSINNYTYRIDKINMVHYIPLLFNCFDKVEDFSIRKEKKVTDDIFDVELIENQINNCNSSISRNDWLTNYSSSLSLFESPCQPLNESVYKKHIIKDVLKAEPKKTFFQKVLSFIRPSKEELPKPIKLPKIHKPKLKTISGLKPIKSKKDE